MVDATAESGQHVVGGLTSWLTTSGGATVEHVAGVAALWAESLTASGELDARQLTAELLGNGRALPPLGRSDVGAGLVQAPM